MVLSLVSLSAMKVVNEHCSSPRWLRWVPRELYGPLLDASLAACRPLAISDLVHRWPERRLLVGGRRNRGQPPPCRACVQALLLAVVKGFSDQRCALRVLDLCGVHDEGSSVDTMGGWSLTVALCTTIVQARAAAHRRHGRDKERKTFSAIHRDKHVKRQRAQRKRPKEANELVLSCIEGRPSRGVLEEGDVVRKCKETDRLIDAPSSTEEEEEDDICVSVWVRADIFINARSWERMCLALSTPAPLKLHCRYLRVEEISVSSIRTVLDLLPRRGLLGVDVRYSNLGVTGLAQLMPLLATFPDLKALRLQYCNLDLRRDEPGQEEALGDLSRGMAQLRQLQRLSLTALRLPGQLCVLLSSLPQPLEVLELPYLSLSAADLSYLSCSHHASSLQHLDLSQNHLDANTLPSMRRFLSQASGTLRHLFLMGCGLNDNLLGLLLPSLGCCLSLQRLALALNPLSTAGLHEAVRTAARMPSLRQLLYPIPLEDYEPGLPELPSSAQLLDWPLDESKQVSVTESRLNQLLQDCGRSDLFLTSDIINFEKD
ncbi:leucine-rich repeat-containing protein 14 [Nerophis lumbriciformis]|uniref:leucine-rich repeat-containing protein 14 n=1 Tax=Nerophis lumbriciformis TaxID=546530 RepID=UPI002ADF9615|nr:leucine-rich repeat-containing protein 14 [Nerophis lumbriciformis]